MSMEAINIVLDLSLDGQVLSFSVQKAIISEGLTEINSNSDFLESCPICTCRISVFTRQPIPKLKTEAISGKEDFPSESYDGFDKKAENLVSSDEDEKPIVELFLVNMKEDSDDKISKSPVMQRKRKVKDGPCSYKENIRRCLHCNWIFPRNSLMTLHQRKFGIVGGPTEPAPDAVKCADHCGRYFSNDEELQKHLKTAQSRNGSYKCDHCLEVFKVRKTLQNHLFEHGPVECPKCKIKFHDSVSFNKHKKIHVEPWAFHCKLCNSGCDSEESLAHHILWVHENKRSCSFCGKIFTRRQDLLNHEKTHKDYAPQQCEDEKPIVELFLSTTKEDSVDMISKSPVKQRERRAKDGPCSNKENFRRCLHCNWIFPCNSQLTQHQQRFGIVGGPTEPAPDAVKCADHCGRYFSNEEELQKHLMTVKRRTGSYKCDHCPEVFRIQRTLQNHLFEHGPVECAKCKLKFKDSVSFNKHIKIHVETKAFHCKLCNSGCDSEESLAHHILWVHENKRSCSFCGKTYTRRQDLLNHEKTHKDHRPYQCDHCGKSFKRANSLSEHLMTHQGLTIICDLCGVKYKQKQFMRYHMLRFHMTSEEIFQCTHCPKRFNALFEFKGHMRQHGKRNFPCSTCGKLFIDKSKLKKHINSMHVELSSRPKFTCETCGKVLLSRITLKTHMNKHKEVSEFKCRYCSKSMTNAHNLQRHEMIHTGERPFTCQTCGKCFRHSDTLKTHIRLHTGEKPYECPLEECKKRFSDRGCFRSHLVVHEKQLNIKLVKKQNYFNDM